MWYIKAGVYIYIYIFAGCMWYVELRLAPLIYVKAGVYIYIFAGCIWYIKAGIYIFAGCMWYVELRLAPLISMIPDKCRLMEFLLLRRDSKMVILTVCKQILMPATQAKLTTIARVFNMLNKVYFNYLEAEVQSMVSPTW